MIPLHTLLLFFGGLVAGSVLAPPLAPQDASLAPGKRVRISRPGHSVLVGTLVRGSLDSVWVALPGQTMAAPIPLIGSTLEVSRGQRSRVVPGALIGLAIGAVVTTSFLAAFCGGDTVCDGDEQVRAGLILGLPPVALGAGIGILIRRENWARVGPSTAGVAGAGGILLGLTLRW